ncbi:hypothetical protein JEZ13_06550 [bacterium]|nr:hypothetical protein [bacterium]
MKKLIYFAVIAVLFLTGCVEYGLTIKVNKDGSGEIVEEMLLSNQVMNMVKAMDPDGSSINAFTKEEVIKKAPNFGDDIVFAKFEEIATESKQGYKAVYNFKDINKIRFSEDMMSESIESLSDNMQMGTSADGEEEESDDDGIDKFYTFDYNKKGQLIISNGFTEAINEARDKQDSSEDVDAEDEEIDSQELQQQLAMAKMFTQGMKIYTKVKFESIKDANVPYENNEVTLFEIDMDQLLKNPETFAEIIKNEEKELTKFLNNERKIDGIIFHNQEKIIINFK